MVRDTRVEKEMEKTHIPTFLFYSVSIILIVLPTVKAEAGQVMKDITSRVGVKNTLKRGAKRAEKSILKRGTQRLMKGKGRTCIRKCNLSIA